MSASRVSSPASTGGAGRSSSSTSGPQAMPSSQRIRLTGTCLILIALLLDACGRTGSPSTQTEVVWRKLGSWSGRASMQTEPFLSDTGSLRLHWETRNETAPGTGTFRVTVHSDVSGRPLVVAVDARGGHGSGRVGGVDDDRLLAADRVRTADCGEGERRVVGGGVLDRAAGERERARRRVVEVGRVFAAGGRVRERQRRPARA